MQALLECSDKNPGAPTEAQSHVVPLPRSNRDIHALWHASLSTAGQLAIARRIVSAKAENYRAWIAQRGLRADQRLLQEIDACSANIAIEHDLDRLREWDAYIGRNSLAWLNRQIRSEAMPWFGSGGREHRYNARLPALLGYGQTLMGQALKGSIKGLGLNEDLGILHGSVERAEGLVLDHSEVFRVHVDRFVLGVINRGIIQPGDFKPTVDPLKLRKKAFKRFRAAFNEMVGGVVAGVCIQDAMRIQIRTFGRFVLTGKPLWLYQWSGAEYPVARVVSADGGPLLADPDGRAVQLALFLTPPQLGDKRLRLIRQ